MSEYAATDNLEGSTDDGCDQAVQLAVECWQDHETSGIEMDSRLAEAFVRRLRPLLAELERERMRLAACGVVAMSNTRSSAARQRIMHDDYRSASCDDVAQAVDREMRYREALEKIVATYNHSDAPPSAFAEIAGEALNDPRTTTPAKRRPSC